MSQWKGLLILGFGGHARSVADVALSLGIQQLCFIDENARSGESFCSFPVKAALDVELEDGWAALPASGDGPTRLEQIEWVRQSGLQLATLVSARATLGVGCEVGAGSFIGHHAHVGPMARIDVGCIINTGAVVEHECVIGALSHISVNAVVAGRSQLGERCFIGAGATVIDGVTLASDVVLGAGSCAVGNLEIAGVYVGVPAKKTANRG